MSATTGQPPQRFPSLDIFRGATIFLMILVNTAGPGAPAFPALVHADWFGFTLADLVFPSFLFAMGNAMSFSLRRPVAAGPYLTRLLRRGAIIFTIGFLMYWYPFVRHDADGWSMAPFALTRVPGVLQRLALCYILAGLLVRWLDWKPLLAVCALLLLGYWAILLGMSLPGEAFSKFGNAGTRLDLFLLSPEHLYKKDGGFDPEGFLGTLPATVNVLAGYLAGLAILRAGSLDKTLRAMAVIGAALAVLGLAWNPWFPISKKLWTGSFVLLTVGLDLILLATASWLFEIKGLHHGKRFFTILGRNPLAIYLFSELFVITLNIVQVPGFGGLYDWIGIALFQALFPGPVGSLLCAFTYTMLCWVVGWALDRKNLILKA
ncbi:heparan-alpha-glucosaminide N-acetyltransferase domain-containing protein [Sphingobium sp. H39-3-25]|uniref:acyltransferase family protein n=1 Tax=Sphingobium arseniciresistens TaxID=3030834 RepID=UPI0023B9F3C0|nr:heparan-alpha-glucosaminide N-acetyltransferase domain-containing protein [Sphingobium arseniciresistens]